MSTNKQGKVKHLCKYHPIPPVFECWNKIVALRCDYPSSGDFPGTSTWEQHPECHGCIVFYHSKSATPEQAVAKWDEYMELWNQGINPDIANSTRFVEKWKQ